MLFVFFDNKEEIFKKHSFLNKVKQICTDLMNQLAKDEVEKLSVFDLESPCLATKKIVKRSPKTEEIAEVKKENINLPIKGFIQKKGQKLGLLRPNLKKQLQFFQERFGQLCTCLADLNEWAKGYRNDDEAVHRKGRYDGGTEEAEQVQMGVENEWDTKQSG